MNVANKLEQKLQFSELPYRRLFETAQDGILILDANSGNIIDVNPYLQNLLGYSIEEFLGKELWQIGVFKDIVSFKKAFVELQHKGYIRYKDLPLQTKDGQSIDVEFVSNIYNVDEKTVIQCNIRDITLKKIEEQEIQDRRVFLEKVTQAQEETREAMLNVMEDLDEAKSIIEFEKVKGEAILQSIGEGIIATDNHGTITVVNRAGEEILGLKDLVGKSVMQIPFEDEDGIYIVPERRAIQKVLRNGKAVHQVLFFVKRNERRIPILINVTPIILDKKIIGAVETLRDITHEKEIDEAKNEFVSLASHQLRTPLGIMKWYLEALENQDYYKDAPAEIKKYINEIYKGNERVLGLVRDLLSVSRIDQGKTKDDPSLVDVSFIINELLEHMKIFAHKKRMDLNLIIKNTNMPLVYIDPVRLHETIENIVNNAIVYTTIPSTIDIVLESRKEDVIVSVKDKGIGISAHDQKKLFTKFFRSNNAIECNPEGSGLGLYVVKSYVDGWGGKVWVKSAVGKGSVFTVSLPILEK